MDVALKEILDHPVIELLTPVESALQLHLVKRSLLQSPTKDVLALKTPEKVIILYYSVKMSCMFSHIIWQILARQRFQPALYLSEP